MSTASGTVREPGGQVSRTKELYDLNGFTVSVATLDDWRQVTEWANGEGWNIGYHDAECFFTIDPEGFFVGRVGDRLVSAVSFVNYSEDYAVAGHYLADPEYRGKGYGREVWQAVSEHVGSRTLTGDAMPHLTPVYQFLRGVPAHDMIHYVGTLDRAGAVAASAVRIGPEHLDAVSAYDAECFPAYRRGFLSKWLFAEGHLAYALLSDAGQVTGYGVVRPAPRGHRIGPLFADTPQGADALFDALTAHLGPGDEVSVFGPETQASARFFGTRGLVEQFRVVHMYRGDPVLGTPTACVYGIASLEIG
jgi:GNAT superfamily N-acetyltransferase